MHNLKLNIASCFPPPLAAGRDELHARVPGEGVRRGDHYWPEALPAPPDGGGDAAEGPRAQQHVGQGELVEQAALRAQRIQMMTI